LYKYCKIYKQSQRVRCFGYVPLSSPASFRSGETAIIWSIFQTKFLTVGNFIESVSRTRAYDSDVGMLTFS